MREPEVPAPAPASQARRAIAVVRGALLGIAQDLVRLRDLLELRLRGLFLIGADTIGMVLHREATVRLLDLGFVRVAPDPELLVVVVRHSSSSPTRRLV